MTVINKKIIIKEIKKSIEEQKQEEKLRKACEAYKVYTKKTIPIIQSYR